MTPLTIAYIGNFEPSHSTENHVRLSLESLGHTVVTLQENRTTVERIAVAASAADVLFHTTTWDCLDHAAMADLMSGLEAPSVAYHLDLFWGLSRHRRDWRSEPMFASDFYFSTDGDNAAAWVEAGINHVWLPAGVYHAECVPGTPAAQYMDVDVAFIGSNGNEYHPEWPYRRELTSHLERAWAGVYANPPHTMPTLRGQALNDFYANAKVTVGDSLTLAREDGHYWSDRVYEATGRGGFLIMPQIDALVDEFDGWLPMYPWGDFEQLDWMIRRYLDRPEVRDMVRLACHERTVQRHTYRHRMATVLKTIGLG